MIVQINKLKIHEIHEKIYQSNDIEDLKQSIQEFGLLEQLKTNKKFVILSGSRRLQAIKELGYKEVNVRIIDINPDDELQTLISFNKQRVKSSREILNEAKYLTSIWSQNRGRKYKIEANKTNNKVPLTEISL